MIDVAQDLRLRAVTLRPPPVLLQLVGERIGILQAFDVATAARIAVPEPRAADAARGLVGADLQAELAQTIDGIEAADARADDDCIELRGLAFLRGHAVPIPSAQTRPSPGARAGARGC